MIHTYRTDGAGGGHAPDIILNQLNQGTIYNQGYSSSLSYPSQGRKQIKILNQGNPLILEFGHNRRY
jgi:hypothetical protein